MTDIDDLLRKHDESVRGWFKSRGVDPRSTHEKDLEAEITRLTAEVERLKAERDGALVIVEKAQAWRTSRTDYLIAWEIALSSHAPIEGGTRYRAHAAVSEMCATDLVAALDAYGVIRKLEDGDA